MMNDLTIESSTPTLDLADYLRRTEHELNLKRREDKFCMRREQLSELIQQLGALDFRLVVHKAEPFFYYNNTYFDTPDHRLYRWHRQGKFNRVQVRIREYLNRDTGYYLECKLKSKGKFSRKERIRLDELSDWRLPYARNFLSTHLKGFQIDPFELVPTIQTGYRRLTWVSDVWPAHYVRRPHSRA
ncbi:VTC domain-containing protein [Candidatus Peregrinibacteria bacterium]|nr:MAG: VTC domain-containing protein [Candidatus Peregrinibacteria bacterium]